MTVTQTSIRQNNVTLGVVTIVAAVFLMSLQDAIVKYASTGLPLWQIYVLRSLIAIPVLIVLAVPRCNWDRLRPGSVPWVALRSFLLVAMYLCIYAAVPLLSLSVVAAAFYTGPLFIAVLSSVLIGERVGRGRWLAVAVGFTGVLVMLRPGTESFSALALLPVLSGLFYALAAITTRAKCSEEPPLALALALNIALLLTGAIASASIALWDPSPVEASTYPFLLSPWSAMGSFEWGVVGALAVLIVGIGVGLAVAYQVASPVTVAAFDYSYLVFAVMWSLLLFAEPPDGATIAGMVLIAGGGLLVLRG